MRLEFVIREFKRGSIIQDVWLIGVCNQKVWVVEFTAAAAAAAAGAGRHVYIVELGIEVQGQNCGGCVIGQRLKHRGLGLGFQLQVQGQVLRFREYDQGIGFEFRFRFRFGGRFGCGFWVGVLALNVQGSGRYGFGCDSGMECKTIRDFNQGFGVKILGSRVHGLKYSVSVLGLLRFRGESLRVQGLGFGVLGLQLGVGGLGDLAISVQH